MKFNKPPKTFAEQLDLLMSRGMAINNHEEALHHLAHLNYYRLAAYWRPFEISQEPHQFIADTSFEEIINYYTFDRQLRLHVLDAIERIEISLRTQWAYQISCQYGSHGYLINNKALQKNLPLFEKNLEILRDHINRSDEKFIQHYRAKYDEPFPPAWVSCEVISLGLLSRFYSNFRAYSVRQKIAATYQTDESFLEGFMEHLCYIRNICAHHGRLWNKHLTKKMPLPKNKPAGLRANINLEEEHKIYNTFVLIVHFLNIISPHHDWQIKLINLLKNFNGDLTTMGFPPKWEQLPIWKK